MDNSHESSPDDRIGVIHHPLYPIPPPPPPGSSSSPRDVVHFPGRAADCRSRGRKHAPTNKPDTDDSFSSIDQQRRTTTRIGFITRVRARETQSRHDMTPAERRAYWIQEDEYLAITRRNARIVQVIESSYDDDDDDETKKTAGGRQRHYPEDLCPRGLEGGLRSECNTRHFAVSDSLEEVFNEQEKQYYIGVRDAEAIAAAYASVSSKAAFRAQLRAMLDRKEIEDFVAATDDDNDDNNDDDDAPLQSASNHTASSTKSKRSTGSKLRKQVASIRSWVRSGTKATRKKVPK